MSFVGSDPHTHQSENCWFTPPEIMKNLGGLFDMDVCTMSFRPFDVAKVHVEHDKGQCAFQTKWKGCVWMNPPYGKEIEPFIEKFKQHNNGIALVFARMGTPWMQKWIKDGGSVFFLRKRVRFIQKDLGKPISNSGADSCFLFCGDEARLRIEISGIEGVFNKD